MWDVILDALIDALKVFPFIFLVYLLIELIEEKLEKSNRKSFIAGKSAPVFAALLGIIPQCGFSVMAAKLYDKKMITTGTILAVFLATSDEAVVILLTNGTKISSILPLLAIKLVFAVIVGMAANAVLKEKTAAFDDEECMCGHEEHAESKWRKYLLHPLGHAAVVFAYILAVNLVFGPIVHIVGEDSFVAFISGSKAFQPLLTCLIGLIPNCASSVIITQAYILGGISFGSCLGGLCVNAGLGYAVLLKDKSNLKRNLLLIGTTFVLSVALGYATNLVVGLIA